MIRGLPEAAVMEGHLRSIGVEFGTDSVDRLALLAGLLVERASIVNLIGPGELKRLWSRHFLESAAFSLLLDRDRPVVDIGSGAGFPGLVLAVLGFRRMMLLEPRRNRRLFLVHAVSRLGLDGVRIAPERIEDAGPFPAGTQFTARAVAPPERLLPAIESVSLGGAVLVCRIPAGDETGNEERLLDLPSPPLDRPGRLVQVPVNADRGRSRHGKGSG